MTKNDESLFPVGVASLEVLAATVEKVGPDGTLCILQIRRKTRQEEFFRGEEREEDQAIAAAVSQLCRRPIHITNIHVENLTNRANDVTPHVRTTVGVSDQRENAAEGVGRFSCGDGVVAKVVATLRAASHAGLLKADYRANHQKAFREMSSELMGELVDSLQISDPSKQKRLEGEGIILEHMNRVASAAVVTAANYPKPDSILSLFDTSAWLFDQAGRRRDAYTDTNLWLAWYPGVADGERTVDEVIESMPAAPESKIPWIVRLFENPESWIRFRGAVDLEDHDVMHVLLGRGLQDQDEAFVIGFAMGTAKRFSIFQYWVFKFVLARLYPEPYRIPRFLQPAFNLGVQCGKETGERNLYRRQLKELRHLSVNEARQRVGIDVEILKKFYEREQQLIPFTIASLRLP